MTGTVRTGNGVPAPGVPSPQDRALALQRLAEARANLAGLERKAAPTVDPSIRAAVVERQRQIEELREQTGRRGRSGRQARQQMEALEGTQRLVVECLGYHTYDEFSTAVERCDATRVDVRVLDAARHEVNAAERHFFDTAEMKAISVPPTPLPTAPRPSRPMAPPAQAARRPVARRAAS